MNGKEIKEQLKSGGQIFGTLITHSSPFWPEKVSEIGFDFVFIDTEHISLDRTQVSSMCRMYDAKGLAPIVRLTSPDPYLAATTSDDGAVGIVAPYVESPEQVRELVGATKLQPLKGELQKSLLSGELAFNPELRDYIEQRNDGRLLVINIESVPALERLDEIFSVPGVDVALIGPHDLSCSLGIPENYKHPKFLKAVSQIIGCAKKYGIASGIHYWTDLDQEVEWCNQGVQMLIHAADIIAFREKMDRELGILRNKLGADTRVNEAAAISI